MASRRNRGELSREDAAIWRRVTDTVRASRPFPELLNDPGPILAPEDLPRPPKARSNSPSKPKPTSAPKPPDEPQLDGRTADRLRRGRIEPERSIDLHGLTLNIAEEMLRRFVLNARRDRLKVVLVITGKGRRGPEADDEVIPKRRGVIRESLPMWISTGSLKGLVLKAVPAHPRHGGAGAWYLYLKRERKPGSSAR